MTASAISFTATSDGRMPIGNNIIQTTQRFVRLYGKNAVRSSDFP